MKAMNIYSSQEDVQVANKCTDDGSPASSVTRGTQSKTSKRYHFIATETDVTRKTDVCRGYRRAQMLLVGT